MTTKIIFANSQRNKKPTVEWFSEIINEVLEVAKAEERQLLEAQRSMSSLETLTKKDLVKIDQFDFYFPSKFGWDVNSYHFKPSLDKIDTVEKSALTFLAQQTERITAAHEKNKPAIENNELIVKGMMGMMNKFGVRSSWSTYAYKSSRSRLKTEQRQNSTWPTDISISVPTDDGYASLLDTIEKCKKQIETWKISETKKLNDQLKIEQQKQKESDKTKWLAYYQIKYKLQPDSLFTDVINEILKKDKYLMLGYWLRKNKGGGHSYAETGLESFVVETDIDKSIYVDIQYQIDNWDYDNYCFENCEYNYDVLFNMVENTDLLTDLNKLEEFTF